MSQFTREKTGESLIDSQDVENAYDIRRREIEGREPIDGRLLVILPVYDAADVLPTTCDRLFAQLRESGLRADVMIVLNSGGGNTSSVLPQITQSCGRSHSEADFGQLVSDTGQNRLWIIDQNGQRGKGHALGHALELIVKNTNYLPETCMILDAETRLYSRNPRQNPIHQLRAQIYQHGGITSPIHQLFRYAQGEPIFDDDRLNAYVRVNNIWSLDPRNSNAILGGCIVADGRVLLNLICTVYDIFPGCSSEDLVAAHFADSLKIPRTTTQSIFFTNRIAADEKNLRAQLQRWIVSGEYYLGRMEQSVREGVHPRNSMADKLLRLAQIGPLEFMRIKRLKQMAQAYTESLRADLDATNAPVAHWTPSAGFH